MPNIVLSRIDERLIHGQVGVQCRPANAPSSYHWFIICACTRWLAAA